jgi:hypothetical protein
MTKKTLERYASQINAPQLDDDKDLVEEAKMLLGDTTFRMLPRSSRIYYMRLFVKHRFFKVRCHKCRKRVNDLYDFIQFKNPTWCMDCMRNESPNTLFEIKESVEEFI